MSDEGAGCVGSLIMIVILLALMFWGATINAITVEAAVARFAELVEVSPSEIEVVRHSNNSAIPLYGDSHDVIFELIIDGKPISGRCTSGVWSPMVCRLYAGGE